MFENNLYTITELSKNESQINSIIRLNPEHDIFKGHFPEMPILPGVCTMQIIKEICSKTLNQTLSLVNGDNIKFTAIVSPDAQKNININITIISLTIDQLTISCQVSCENIISFKMKASYSCKPNQK